jgi:hypothetical protein
MTSANVPHGWDAIDAPNVPNLDAMDASELREYARSQSIGSAPDGVPQYDLYRYAMLRADAIEQRLAGRIPQALRIEAQCQGIYYLLPQQYRW